MPFPALRLALCCALFATLAVAQPGAYRIAGTVVDADSGAPLARAAVLVTAAGGNRPPLATVVTGPDGRFSFEHLAAGKYGLAAQRRGYLTEALDQHDNYSTAVAVGPGLVADAIVYRLHRYASLSGRVLDETNEPVAQANVMLFVQSTERRGAVDPAGSTQTDDQGFYHFSRLRAGAYFLVVSAQPWYAQHPQARFRAAGDGADPVEPPPSPLDVAYPVTFYPDATDAESATPIILGVGERVTADMLLHALPAVHLRIHAPATNTPGQPPLPVGFTVYKRLFGEDIPVPSVGGGDGRGLTDISGLAPGKYGITLMLHEDASRTEVRQDVDLAATTDLDAEAPGQPLTKVSGTAEFETPVAKNSPPASIYLRNTGGRQTYVAQVKPSGEFAFNVPLLAGTYQVSVDGPNRYIKAIAASGAHVSGRDLEVGHDPVTLAVVVGEGVAAINGTALRDGKPQAGAMIVLVPEFPATQQVLFRRDQSDSDGTFTLPTIVPGKYVVLAFSSWDIPWHDPDFLRQYLARGHSIDVQPRGRYQLTVDILP